jgi:hypothetical protein
MLSNPESTTNNLEDITPPEDRHFGPYVVSHDTLLKAGFSGFYYEKPIKIAYRGEHADAHISKLNNHHVAIIRFPLDTMHVKWCVGMFPVKPSTGINEDLVKPQDYIKAEALKILEKGIFVDPRKVDGLVLQAVRSSHAAHASHPRRKKIEL